VDRRSQRGQGIIEYSIIFLLMVALAILLMLVFGGWLTGIYQSILNAL
jgi:Flp pilus assembly pilin Flp